MAEVRLEATSGGSLEKLEAELRDVEAELERLKGVVASVSGKPLDFATDPAEADVKRLVGELAKLEAAFRRAEQSVSFAHTRSELEQTDAAARRLANAEAVLAARGRELIEFSRRLPPELARDAAGMDALEKQTEQAAAAFRQFEAARPKSAGIGGLVRAIGSLRAGLAGLVAALGVQQLIRFGRALIDIGADAVETKKKFDALTPALREFVGSTELANEVADRLASTADRLKTPLASLINPFLGISSGGREAGLSIAEINDLFEASLISARTFGKGADEVQRLLTGISQVAGKGVASMEELRQQIGEAIPNAIPALAKGLGVTVPEAIAKISSGTLDSAVALRALTRGFEELNRAAGLAQLDTLAGDLGAFERASEKARSALADGLEPGLRAVIQAVTDLIDQNPDLIRQLGELGSAGLEGLASLVSTLSEVREGYKVVGLEALDTAKALAFVAQTGTPGAAQLAEAYQKLGNVLADTRGKAEAEFQALEAAARTAAFAAGGAISEAAGVGASAVEDAAERSKFAAGQSAEEILATFRETFTQQAEAAGLAAVDIERTQKELADRVGAISEQSAEYRAALEEQFIREAERIGGARPQVEQAIHDEIARLDRDAIAQREKLLDELVEETKKAAAERIAAEEAAKEEIARFLEEVVATARELGEKRAADDAEITDKIVKIRQEGEEKILAAIQKAAEAAQKAKADREKIAADLSEAIIDIERDTAEKIRTEQERIAEAAEKAAERQLKAQQKVRADLEKSIEKFQKLVDLLKEVAEGGGSFEEITDQINDFRATLNDFIIDLEQLNEGATIGDAGSFLEKTFAGLDAQLDKSQGSFDSWFTGVEAASDGAKEAGDKIRDEFIDALREAADAAEGLSGPVRDTVTEIIASYTDLAAQGEITRQDFQSLADALKTAFAGAGQAVGDPIAEIRQQLASLGEAQGEAGEAAEESGKKQEEAAKGAAVETDKATKSIGQVGEEWEKVGDAVERGGQRIERGADGLIKISDAAEKVGDTGATAKDGLDKIADGAQAAGPPLQAVADAAQAIPDELVAEGQPDLLRDLGAAAGEALPSIEPLAAPTTALAEASTSLAESLPVLAEQLPVISTAAAELLALLAESPVDFEALSSQVAALAEPLTTIQEAIVPISEAIAGLPKPLAELQTAAEPLFALAAEAGEDDRFGKIGAGLQSMANALPAIPEPLQAAQVALEALAAKREEIQGTLDDIAKGLTAVAAEEVLKGLADLAVALEDLNTPLEQAASQTEKWQKGIDAIVEAVPNLNVSIGTIADNLNDKVIPALKAASDDTDGLRQQMVDLKGAMDEAAGAAENLGKVGAEALDQVRAKAVEAAAALRDVAAAAGEAAAALANVQLP